MASGDGERTIAQHAVDTSRSMADPEVTGATLVGVE